MFLKTPALFNDISHTCSTNKQASRINYRNTRIDTKKPPPLIGKGYAIWVQASASIQRLYKKHGRREFDEYTGRVRDILGIKYGSSWLVRRLTDYGKSKGLRRHASRTRYRIENRQKARRARSSRVKIRKSILSHERLAKMEPRSK